MDRLVKTLKRPVSGVGEAAFLLGLFTLVSQLLGMARDRTLAHMFGASRALDIYYASFRFPDFLFVTVASLVSMSILIPYLADAKRQGSETFNSLVSDLFFCFSAVIALVCAAVFFALPWLTARALPGFSAEDIRQAVMLSRIILLSPIFLGFSNLLASVAQTYGRFAAYALAPALYNLGIIFGTVFLAPHFGILGVAIGVAIGAALHCGIQIFSLGGLVSFWEIISLHDRLGAAFRRIKEIAFISVPRTIALSANSIALLGLLSLGSVLGAGAIAGFTFSNNLQSVAVSIIGVSFGMGAFPFLSAAYKAGKKAEFTERIVETARQIVFFTIPASCFLVVFRAHIVRLVLGSGAFDWQDTRLVAAALAIFAVSLVFQSLDNLFVRALYAAGDTKKTLVTSAFGAGSMIVVAYAWHHFAPNGLVHGLARVLRVGDLPSIAMLALPLGFAVGATIETITQWIIIEKRFPFTKKLARPFGEALLAGLAGSWVSYFILQHTARFFLLTTFAGLLFHAIVAALPGLLVSIAVFFAFRNGELKSLFRTLRVRFRGVTPQPADTDVLS